MEDKFAIRALQALAHEHRLNVFRILVRWASTSFANPAVTIGRAFTDTFSGIHPSDAPAFIVAQLIGALIATVLFGWIFSSLRPEVARQSVE